MIQSKIVFISLVLVFMGFFAHSDEAKGEEKKSGYWNYYCDLFYYSQHYQRSKKHIGIIHYPKYYLLILLEKF